MKIDLNDTTNRILVAMAVGLVFVIGWWLIARTTQKSGMIEEVSQIGMEEENTTTTPETMTAKDTPRIVGSSEVIAIGEQGAGMQVVVSSATLAQVSWVAIRDADGRTLGAGRFEAGTHTNIEVPLLRATNPGSYQALIYVDDGDKIFDLKSDILVTRDDGSVVGVSFTAR